MAFDVASGRTDIVLPPLQVPPPRERRTTPFGEELPPQLIETAQSQAQNPQFLSALFHAFDPQGGAPAAQTTPNLFTVEGATQALSRGRDLPIPGRDSQNPSEEAWKQYLGLPTGEKFIKPTDEKPAIAQDDDAQYFNLEGFWENFLDPEESFSPLTQTPRLIFKTDEGLFPLDVPEDFDEEQKLEFVWHFLDGQGGGMVADGDALGIKVLRDFTLGAGEDEQGRYLSYYDVWDLDQPFEGVVGKPFEFYGRRYINEDEDD